MKPLIRCARRGDFTVKEIDPSVAVAFVLRHHYAKGCTNAPGPCFGLFDKKTWRLMGAMIFANSCSEAVRESVFGKPHKNSVTELHRLVLLDETPFNSESMFVARALRKLKRLRSQLNAVVSFADISKGHVGVEPPCHESNHIGGHMKEYWAPTPGYETHYEVSNLGRIRRLGAVKCRKPVRTRTGYFVVNLSIHNQQKIESIHRLVAIAFLGYPLSTDLQVNHIDGNKANNAVENLEWTTPQENMRHAFAHGLATKRTPPHSSGEKHPNAKLTREQAHEIKFSREPRKVLASRYGVSISAIKAIRRGVNWPDV